MSKIRVIYIAPGKDAEERDIDNTHKAMQDLVGGKTKAVKVCSDLIVVCGKKGRSGGMPYNCDIVNKDLYGPVIICGVDGDEFTDMPLGLQMFMQLGAVKRRRYKDERT